MWKIVKMTLWLFWPKKKHPLASQIEFKKKARSCIHIHFAIFIHTGAFHTFFSNPQ